MLAWVIGQNISLCYPYDDDVYICFDTFLSAPPNVIYQVIILTPERPISHASKISHGHISTFYINVCVSIFIWH